MFRVTRRLKEGAVPVQTRENASREKDFADPGTDWGRRLGRGEGEGGCQGDFLLLLPVTTQMEGQRLGEKRRGERWTHGSVGSELKEGRPGSWWEEPQPKMRRPRAGAGPGGRAPQGYPGEERAGATPRGGENCNEAKMGSLVPPEGNSAGGGVRVLHPALGLPRVGHRTARGASHLPARYRDNPHPTARSSRRVRKMGTCRSKYESA